MNNLMKIKRFIGGKTQYELYTCPCRDCECKNPDKIIPTYYSYQHAHDEGWRFTNDIRFKEPGTMGDVAVCPDCSKKCTWKPEREVK